MTKTVQVKTGLTGAEKKFAKHFGGVVVEKRSPESYVATFKDHDVYAPSYGGSIIMSFAMAHDATALRAAKELIRTTQLTAELGRQFMVGDKQENPEHSPLEDDLVSKGFKHKRLPAQRR